MEYFDTIFDIEIKNPTAITIGKFDGFHKGHHLLISEIISKKAKGLSSCLITFKNSPRLFLSKDRTLSLFTNKERDYILEKNGINYLIECEFNKKFMQIEATKFIEILCKNLNMKYLVIGEDFRFGYKGAGNIELLKILSKKYGFELKIINKVKINNKDISSSIIREEILKGNIDKVNEMLGYEYFIIGETNWKELSKNRIGMNPLVIIPHKDKLIPRLGVYYTKIIYEGKIYNGITKIRKNQSVNDDYKCSEDDVLIETYSIELPKELNGKEIILIFKKYYGEKMIFYSFEDIKMAIK